MKIVPYQQKYKQAFIDLNKEWLSEMFVIEPADLAMFESIDELIDKGGQIFFAIDDFGEVLSCCMLEPHSDGDWEIAKFATTKKARGKGIGRFCFDACLDHAKKIGLKKILIVSNTKCEAGIHLYRKNGFTEIPLDRKKFPYERANIAFEKIL